MLRKYFCEGIVKHSLDENDIRKLAIWADAEDPDYVHQVAYEYGWELIPDSEIFGSDEYAEDDEIYDYVEFIDNDEY